MKATGVRRMSARSGIGRLRRSRSERQGEALALPFAMGVEHHEQIFRRHECGLVNGLRVLVGGEVPVGIETCLVALTGEGMVLVDGR